MFYWMKPLPAVEIDRSKWKPFIKNDWFRRNFMWFVYALQICLLAGTFVFRIWSFFHHYIYFLIFLLTFLIHEFLHVAVVINKGDISLTHSGIFFWLNTDAKMTKLRFWLFMSMPLLVLSLLPAVMALVINQPVREYFISISWINAIIAGADIINSALILCKPAKAIFYRGFVYNEN